MVIWKEIKGYQKGEGWGRRRVCVWGMIGEDSTYISVQKYILLTVDGCVQGKGCHVSCE